MIPTQKPNLLLHFEEQSEAFRAEFAQMWTQWRDVLVNDFHMRDEAHLAGSQMIAWRAFLHWKTKGEGKS